MHYYAVYDFTVRPENPGHGFCNTKRAICFTTKKGRDAFVMARGDFDMSCQKITCKEAKKYLESYYGDGRKKGLQVDNLEGELVCLKS